MAFLKDIVNRTSTEMKKEVMVEGNGEVVLEKKKKKEISMELLR